MNDPNIEVDSSIEGGVAWYPQTDFSSTDEELEINNVLHSLFGDRTVDINKEYEPAFPRMESSYFPFHEAKDGVIEQFLGKLFDKNSKLVKEASPINYVKKNKEIPSILIQHGSGDEILPVQQSIRFILKVNNLLSLKKVELDIIPHAIHSSVLFETDENIQRILDFIDSVIKC